MAHVNSAAYCNNMHLMEMRMRHWITATCTLLLLGACTAANPPGPLDDYEELHPSTLMPAPPVTIDGNVYPNAAERGRYFVELLGCATCHTDGALLGAPRRDLWLAGSSTGIAYSNPLVVTRPGVVFAPNLTPDSETGIGRMSDAQLDGAIRGGLGRHGKQLLPVMPGAAFSRLTADDSAAIISYLRSLPPVRNPVPGAVEPGEPTTEQFVYFGVYRARR